MSSLPPFLLINRRPRRAAGPRAEEAASAAGDESQPATRPRRVGAPEESLADLGIPADAVELEKVPAVAGVDENYSSSSDPSALRPRRAVSPAGEIVNRARGVDQPVEDVRGAFATAVSEQPTEPLPAAARPAPSVEFDPLQSATRARITDPAGRLEKQITFEQQNRATDTNGWWGTLKETGRGFLEHGLMGAASRGITNAFDKSSDERASQQRRVGGYQRDLTGVRARQKSALDLEGQRADIGVKNANRGWLEARPGIEADKLQAKTNYDAWRMAHAERKQDSAENYIAWRMENGDRRADTADGRLELSREWQDFNKGFLTRKQDETERHNKVGEAQGDRRLSQGDKRLEQGDQRLDIMRDNLKLAERRIEVSGDKTRLSRVHQAQTLIGKSKDLYAKAEYYERMKIDGEQPAWARSKAKLFRDQAGEIERRIEAEYDDIRVKEMTLQEFKEAHPDFADDEPWQIEEAAHAHGIKIADYDSSLEGSATGTDPRNSSPAASAPASASGKSHVSRAKFRSKYPQYKGQSDADVDAAIRASGYEPIP